MSVVAPPERPRPDELEALIREARARQLRRRYALVAWVALAAGAVIGAHSLLASNGRAVPSSGADGGSGPQPCRLSALAVREIAISNPTGLDRLGLQFTNRAGSSCQVAGYPAILFRDATGTVPFLFRRLGTPRPVTLPAYRSTFSIFSKFRCDIGVSRSATETVVSVPGDSSTVVIPGGPSICKPGIAAEGRWVTLTPFESPGGVSHLSDRQRDRPVIHVGP